MSQNRNKMLNVPCYSLEENVVFLYREKLYPRLLVAANIQFLSAYSSPRFVLTLIFILNNKINAYKNKLMHHCIHSVRF